MTPLRRRGHEEPERWGPWHLDSTACLLWTEAGRYRYEIDLYDCDTSAQILDWICQIADKLWGDDLAERNAITAGLVNALIDVLHPQANLCSWGQSTKISKAQIKHLVSSR